MFTDINMSTKLSESPPQVRGRPVSMHLRMRDDRTVPVRFWSHDQRNFRHRKRQGAVQMDKVILIKKC